MVKGDAPIAKSDMVFDFLDLKPIVRQVCDSLDHKLLIPGENLDIEISTQDTNYLLKTKDNSSFSIPIKDVLILPITNTSAERLAQFICKQIIKLTNEKFQFSFKELEVEVEETPGQSAIYIHKEIS